MQNEERIAVLELQYRNMKRIVLGVAWVISLNFAICSLIIVGYFVSTTNAPDVIQAKKFEVLNDDGKMVAFMGASRNGGWLSIHNKDGESVAGFLVEEENGGLYINNSDGEQVFQIAVSSEFGGMLGTFNNKGEVTSSLP